MKYVRSELSGILSIDTPNSMFLMTWAGRFPYRSANPVMKGGGRTSLASSTSDNH